MAFLATSDPPAPFGDEARMDPLWPWRMRWTARRKEADTARRAHRADKNGVSFDGGICAHAAWPDAIAT